MNYNKTQLEKTYRQTKEEKMARNRPRSAWESRLTGKKIYISMEPP